MPPDEGARRIGTRITERASSRNSHCRAGNAAYNPETCEVKELKPNNERAKRRGAKQVEEYVKELEEATGKKHTGTVETYDP